MKFSTSPSISPGPTSGVSVDITEIEGKVVLSIFTIPSVLLKLIALKSGVPSRVAAKLPRDDSRKRDTIQTVTDASRLFVEFLIFIDVSSPMPKNTAM